MAGKPGSSHDLVGQLGTRVGAFSASVLLMRIRVARLARRMARLPTLSLEVPSEFRKAEPFRSSTCTLSWDYCTQAGAGGESTPAPPCRASAALESVSPAPPTTPPCARSRPARGPHPRQAASATPRPAPAAGRSAAAPSPPPSASPAFGSRRPETDSKSSYLCRGWGANPRRVDELSSWWVGAPSCCEIRP